MRFTLLLTAALLWLHTTAQKEVINVATRYIVSKDYDGANRYLDSLLQQNPNMVDALMMKGNVMLNRDLADIGTIGLQANNSEAVSDNSAGSIVEVPKIVPRPVAQKVAALWQQCLQVDSTRIDILKGLCTLYSMALMKDELKKYLKLLAERQPGPDERAYDLAEYARKLKERNAFNDAMDVYFFIAGMFPNLAGIRSDIAGEYFYNGQINTALRWVDSAIYKPNIDETTYLNCAFMYSQLGYFDAAQKLLDKYSATYQREMGLFYKGLRGFAEANKEWPATLRTFLLQTDSNAYYNESLLAKQLLAYDTAFTLQGFRYLLHQNLPEYYRVFVYQRAIKQYPDSCEPFLQYGAYQNQLQNYSAAVQFLQEGEQCNITGKYLSEWQLQYGYALYKMKQYGKSRKVLLPLLTHTDAFLWQAASYLLAGMLIQEKKTEEAKALLKKIVAGTESTKYTTLAKYRLDDLP